jgi:hypothetical protein
MDHVSNPFHVVDLSAERRGMVAFQELKEGKHCMYALLEVDVGFMIELKKGEKSVLIGHVVRAANRKTFWDIYRLPRA